MGSATGTGIACRPGGGFRWAAGEMYWERCGSRCWPLARRRPPALQRTEKSAVSAPQLLDFAPLLPAVDRSRATSGNSPNRSRAPARKCSPSRSRDAQVDGGAGYHDRPRAARLARVPVRRSNGYQGAGERGDGQRAPRRAVRRASMDGARRADGSVSFPRNVPVPRRRPLPDSQPRRGALVLQQQLDERGGAVPALAAARLEVGVELVDQRGHRQARAALPSPARGRCRCPCASIRWRSRSPRT